MSPQPAAPQDSPLAVTPPIQPRMPWRVAAVDALPDFRLHVQFVDGTEGMVDLAALFIRLTPGSSPPLPIPRSSIKCLSSTVR